jgi:hypothetical protein
MTYSAKGKILLTSVLPGLRELRTPLVTGYLWLVVTWVVVSNQVPRVRPTGAAQAALWDLGSMLGRPALIVGLTSIAYLVGALIELNPERLWRYGGRPKWITLLLGNGRILQAVRRPALSATTQRDIVRVVLGQAEEVDPQKREEVFVRILTQIRQLAIRLQAQHPELYEKYDRLLTEARLRFNIAAPSGCY